VYIISPKSFAQEIDSKKSSIVFPEKLLPVITSKGIILTDNILTYQMSNGIEASQTYSRCPYPADETNIPTGAYYSQSDLFSCSGSNGGGSDGVQLNDNILSFSTAQAMWYFNLNSGISPRPHNITNLRMNFPQLRSDNDAGNNKLYLYNWGTSLWESIANLPDNQTSTINWTTSSISNPSRFINVGGSPTIALQNTVPGSDYAEYDKINFLYDYNNTPLTLTPNPYDFGNTAIGGVSSSQTFTLTNNGYEPIIINISLGGTNADQFEFVSGGGSGVTLSGNATRNIVIRFKPTSIGAKTATLNVVPGNSDFNSVSSSLSGTGVQPLITVSATSLTDFGNIPINTNSATKSYTVSGSNLTANISISAPSGFQISTSQSSGFSSSLTLTQSSGTVSTTTIYARFSPTTTGNQSGNISHTSTGASTKNVSVSGTGVQLSISGTIKWKNWPNNGLSGFIARATNTTTLVNYDSPQSGTDGSYIISNIPNGTYNLTVLNSTDYFTTAPNPITINNSNATDKNIQLEGRATAQVRIVAPPSFVPGQPFNITVYLKNTSYTVTTLTGYLDISFPENPTVAVSSHTFPNSPQIYNPGQNIYPAVGNPIQALHRLAEGIWSGTINYNEEKQIVIQVTPATNSTSLSIRYRGIIFDKYDPTNSSPPNTTDQQGWPAKVLVIPADLKPDLTISNPSGPTSVQAGSLIEFDCIENNMGTVTSEPNKVGIYLSTTQYGTNVLLGDEDVPQISPGYGFVVAAEPVTIPFNTAPGSGYWITFFADYQNVVNEGTTGEQNNINSYPITINPPPATLSVIPVDIDLGAHPQGYNFNSSFIVKNIGGYPLSGSISESATWITNLFPTTFSLAANQEQTINYSGTFPVTTGVFNTNITLTSNGGNQNINVHGIIGVPDINVSPNSLTINETSTSKRKINDAQSTTGPNPPKNISRGLPVSIDDYQVIIQNVPSYLWHNGCGPTSAGMVIGYWDGHGYANLISGDATQQTAAVNDMISNAENYDDYCLPIDSYPNLLSDLSEPPSGDEHIDNCVADYMKTSQSARPNYYGWSWFSDIDNALLQYVQNFTPQYIATVENVQWGTEFTWDIFREEIDANRPVILLVDTDGNDETDHFVPAVGYGLVGTTQMYACYDTWDNNIHWYEFAEIAIDQDWGIFGATLFSLSGDIFTISNTGNGPLLVDNISTNKSWLTLAPSSPPSINIQAGDSQVIAFSVNWNSVPFPDDQAIVTINSNDPDENPVYINVTAIPASNPIPNILSINPTNKIAGSSGFPLTVNGTNFNSSSVVRFNGSNRVTTYVNSTQLTASILSSDLLTAGSYPVTVFNPAPGGGTSNASIFTIVQEPQYFQVSGIISYDNTSETGLSNVNVNLLQNGNIISSSASGTTGDYLFNNVVNGSYSLNSSSTKIWGGVNSTDALQIRRHIAGISLLTGLRLLAADVNASSTITSTDALLIRRRVAGLDATFASGDWLFENPAFNVSGQNVIQNFKGLCFGDVNGSYAPSVMMSKESFVNSSGNSEIYLKNNEVLSVPIKTLNPLNISALTLIIKYPSESIEIQSVSSKLEGLLYNIQDDEILIAWDDLSSVSFKPDEVIITLIIKNKNQTLKKGEISFSIGPNSEFADGQANVIKDVLLDIPRIKINYPVDFSLLDCYPNPFNPSTTIEYKLPETSVVRLEIVSIIGERVGLLIDGTQEAGTHRLQWDASELPSGVYIYRLVARGERDSFSKVKKMLLIK